MPNVATRRRRPRNGRQATRPKFALMPAPARVRVEEKPVRGVKLKTVSTLTLAFALLCVAAFAAGRPPASAAGPTVNHGAKEHFRGVPRPFQQSPDSHSESVFQAHARARESATSRE
jgi:hypothetical protein